MAHPQSQQSAPPANPMGQLASRPELAAAVLAAGEQRRVSTDAMMWQVPALSLTAQSFLLTIVLGSSATRGGRAVAAGVGLVVAVGALQQMLKHRYHEVMLSRWLETLEEALALPRLHDLREKGDMLTLARKKGEPDDFWVKRMLWRCEPSWV